MPVKTIQWSEDKLKLIDQTLLPLEYRVLEIIELQDVTEAIKSLRIRGAPAIGIAAAFGIYLGVKDFSGEDSDAFFELLEEVSDQLIKTRPTAVNLRWAVERVKKVAYGESEADMSELKKLILNEALKILEEDRKICRKIGEIGSALLPDEGTGLTHCNAGGLATADYGTALAVIYSAVEKGKKIRVFADETRPLLQGARLTTWELMRAGIDVTLICDNTAGYVMKKGLIDFVIVGADRIAVNGDVANKIGTYSLAILAERHGIPFYVAAPISTIDPRIKDGDSIIIEERAPEEVIESFGKRVAPEGVKVFSPAFDVTPSQLITAIITEAGIFRKIYNFQELFID
ncbi:MAG: S-methyl-5-thioribose-1-phosphate isomerase [Fidelibacterota bacterium]